MVITYDTGHHGWGDGVESMDDVGVQRVVPVQHRAWSQWVNSNCVCTGFCPVCKCV